MKSADWKEDIANYIEKYAESEYDGVLERDNRFDLFYHLSENRKGVLGWYDFSPEADLLEVGGGYGALSSLFSERCKRVTVTEKSAKRAELLRKRLRKHENVTVLTGDLQEDSVRELLLLGGYDYIVVLGILELKSEPVSFLKELKNLLKPGGKLLVAVDNAYGAHYLAGGLHPYAKMQPFDSINGRGRVRYTRKTLIKDVEAAGFAAWKLFYPVPDYHFAQVIYSDAYLPRTKLAERIRLYTRNVSSPIANEKRMLDDAVNNGAFPFLANSFLVECMVPEPGMDMQLSKIDFAAVTLERKRARSCVTKIYADGIVSKQAVHPEGIQGLVNMVRNTRDLQEHELHVVPCEWKDEKVWMPFCDAPLLSSVLDDFIEKGAEAFAGIFDKLYENILQSSKQVAEKKNALLTQESSGLNWGPVLEKCYFEMIPMNCFYDEGRFVYFDQEFVRDNFPAKYTLYRALRNTYLFNPKVAQCISLSEMKARYGLEEIWDIFEEADDRFLQDIRKAGR